jgi:hypothetical protein
MTDHRQLSIQDQLLRDAELFWLDEKSRLRHGYGAAGFALCAIVYFAIQMFFASVKNCNASLPPSRPTPLCFMPTLLPE